MNTTTTDRSARAVTSIERAQKLEHVTLGSAYAVSQPWSKNFTSAPAGVLS